MSEGDRITVDELLARARSKLRRVEPLEARDAIAAGDAVLVDIRSESQRALDGVVPDALYIARNLLEWRCDPSSPWRDPAASDPSRRLIVMCSEGHQSTLAAAALHDLGLHRATDLVGGFRAWRAAGLPVASSTVSSP